MGLAYPLLALVNLIAGGFLIAAVFGFSDETATELGFAVSIGVVIFGPAMVWAGREEGESAGITALGLATAILAGWTVIATSVYDPSTAVWLVLASACGHVVLSLAGIVGDLIARESALQEAQKKSSSGRKRSGGAKSRSSGAKSRSSGAKSRSSSAKSRSSGAKSGSKSKSKSGSSRSSGSRSRSTSR